MLGNSPSNQYLRAEKESRGKKRKKEKISIYTMEI
jgi:hypothetical protein